MSKKAKNKKQIEKAVGASADSASPQVTIPLESAEKFFSTFEKSARRWEMVVYPGMAFVIIFLLYGFYLIYNLTTDMRNMVARFDDPQITNNLIKLSEGIDSLNANIKLMSGSVVAMTNDTSKMSLNMTKMTGNFDTMTGLMDSVTYMESMYKELKQMNQSVALMNRSVNAMGRDMRRLGVDMSQMNRSVSRPLNLMNSFMPF